jgi:predicted metalloendopeptidase
LGQYLALVKAPASTHYLVSAPEFFKNLETLLERHSLDHWKAYLRWQMLHGSANALNAGFVNENSLLGEALGEVYVTRAFPPESKRSVLDLVRAIEAEMSNDVGAQNWMAAETKRRAIEQLNALLNKIGYPDRWRD